VLRCGFDSASSGYGLIANVYEHSGESSSTIK
jgi:hypothetical protein